MTEEQPSETRILKDEASYRVVKVGVPIVIQCQPSQTIAAVAEKIFDWLNGLHYLAPNATKFLRGIDFTQDRYHLTALSLPNSSDKQKELVLPC